MNIHAKPTINRKRRAPVGNIWFRPAGLDERSAKEIMRTSDFKDDGNAREVFVQALHRECAVLISGNTIRYVHTETIEDVLEISGQPVPIRRRIVSRFTKADFLGAFDPAQCTAVPEGSNRPRKFKLAERWIESPDRHEYTGERFLPGAETPPNILNLWSGWNVTPEAGEWSILRGHLHDNLCNGDAGLFAWVLDWLAHMVQKPTRKPGTALVFRGLKGTGKTKLAEWLTFVCGQHGMICDKADQITGHFNGHLADKLLIVADEATWGGSKQAVGALNMLITSASLPIERKGQDIIDMPSYHRLIVIGNDEWNVPATHDERRYCVLDVGDKRRKDRQFFAALDRQMLNGGVEAMFYELLHRRITNDVGDAPKTEALGHQVAAGLSPVWRAIVDIAAQGGYYDERKKDFIALSDTTTTIVRKSDFMAHVKSQCRHRPAPREIGAPLQQLRIKFTMPRQTDGSRPRMCIIPKLTNLISAIESAQGYSLEVLSGYDADGGDT